MLKSTAVPTSHWKESSLRRPEASTTGGHSTTCPADRRPTVLRDMKQWFREFKVVPDSLRSSGGEAKLEERMRLFQKHGWPDAFDSKAFQTEPVGKNSARLAAWHAEAPLRVMKRLEDDSERASRWAEVGRLGSSAPVDETALKVVQLKRAQCADAFEASRAAAKNLQPKGPVRAQLEYARRRRDNDYHSGLLQFRKKEFSFVARKWSILPDVQALED